MHMPMIGRVLSAVLLLAAGTASAGENKGAARIAGTYTNLEYHKQSGDLIGVEIKIVPLGDRYQGMVVVSEGEPLPVVVADVKLAGRRVSFEVWSGQRNSWKFAGTVTAKALTGTITHDLGGTEKVVLQRRCGYWDR